ncbi:MAG: ABC transporter permease [Gammaproteobacteria bacterium]|nr:ABC transporter permease [Gammaproteobacteria bacterium]
MARRNLVVIAAQLRTLLWLRGRLLLNHTRRHGKASLVIYVVFQLIAAGCAVAALVTGYLLGRGPLAHQPPGAVLLTIVGVTAFYLLFALVGLLSDLQQSDALSLRRLLHLPMTARGAFLVNYAVTCLGLNTLVCGGAMLGLSLGLWLEVGTAAALLLPLSGAFFVMMTALVHQFRGWLASMVISPRRRQTLTVIVSGVFIVILMLPSAWVSLNKARRPEAVAQQSNAGAERVQREAGPDRHRRRMSAEDIFVLQARVRLATAILPPGWLAYGAASSMERRVVPALGCLSGMILIGLWSLGRSYRTTLRMYQGHFIATPDARATSPTPAPRRDHRERSWNWRFPVGLEPAAGVAAASFRILLRRPEMKLTLLVPLMMLVLFGGMARLREAAIGDYGGALRAMVGAAFMLLMSVLYLMTNQFAFDRAGFRAFVLAPLRRREVLLGKNLALFPFAAALMLLAVGFCHWLAPLRLDHLAAVCVNIVAIYLVNCMIGNALSIGLPVIVKTGTAMPGPGQTLRLVVRFLLTLASWLPLTLLLWPLALEFLLQLGGRTEVFPAFLVFSLLQTAGLLWLYHVILDQQGEWLLRTEQQILTIVATAAD